MGALGQQTFASMKSPPEQVCPCLPLEPKTRVQLAGCVNGVVRGPIRVATLVGGKVEEGSANVDRMRLLRITNLTREGTVRQEERLTASENIAGIAVIADWCVQLICKRRLHAQSAGIEEKSYLLSSAAHGSTRLTSLSARLLEVV